MIGIISDEHNEGIQKIYWNNCRQKLFRRKMSTKYYLQEIKEKERRKRKLDEPSVATRRYFYRYSFFSNHEPLKIIMLESLIWIGEENCFSSPSFHRQRRPFLTFINPRTFQWWLLLLKMLHANQNKIKRKIPSSFSHSPLFNVRKVHYNFFHRRFFFFIFILLIIIIFIICGWNLMNKGEIKIIFILM